MVRRGLVANGVLVLVTLAVCNLCIGCKYMLVSRGLKLY